MDQPEQKPIDLLPCPFCGAEAIGPENHSFSCSINGKTEKRYKFWKINCSNKNCQAEIEDDSEKKTAKGWNKRTK